MKIIDLNTTVSTKLIPIQITIDQDTGLITIETKTEYEIEFLYMQKNIDKIKIQLFLSPGQE